VANSVFVQVEDIEPFVPSHLPGASGMWPSGTRVRYRIASLPTTRPAIDLATMSRIMSAAFTAWKSSGHLPIDFVEVTNDPCEIIVKWENFAGTGLDGFLARSDYPPPSGTTPNEIAFNDDLSISWAVGNVNAFEYDLGFIALHEVGHAIGLAHSTSHQVVMTESVGIGPGIGLAPADTTAAGLLYAQPIKNTLASAFLRLLGAKAGSRRALCGSIAAGAATVSLSQAAPLRRAGGQAGST
jgi:hypothetical protein